jgi:hypothetical protein
VRMFSVRRRAGFSQFSDREQAYALALIMVGIVLVTVATVAILIENAARQDARESARRMLGPPAGETPDRSGSRSDLAVAEYVNGTHDYGFDYPASWTVHEKAQITSLENPNGRIHVRFGIGPSNDLETTAARSIHSLSDVTSDRDVIGMKRERIDGSSSLLVSGTAIDDGGRRVRFLSITVPGQTKNYAISILVPRRSDPVTVLPQIEEIVSSFDVLSTGAEVSG